MYMYLHVLKSTYALKPGANAAVSNIMYLCNGYVTCDTKNMCVHGIMQRASVATAKAFSRF